MKTQKSTCKFTMEEDKNAPWKKPNGVHKIKKLQTQKRALQDRLFDFDSPTKRSRKAGGVNGPRKSLERSFHQSPVPVPISLPEDDSACDDSTLMDLLGLRPIPGEGGPSGALNFSQLVASQSKPTIPVHASPVKALVQSMESPQPRLLLAQGEAESRNNSFMSPLKAFIATDGLSSPSKDPRRTVVPRRLPLSPSFSFKSRPLGRKPLTDMLPPAEGGPGWHQSLCLDLSLKSELGIISPHNYGWTSNNLKTSEESSGVSAFVRCIDIVPPENGHPSFPSMGNSQLDTSLGAQFHQCCLYWQHPAIPGMSLFPRGPLLFPVKPRTTKMPVLRFDNSMIEAMHSEWVAAVRSAFHLLKARQCPFFYICTNTFTCLFCSAGTLGDEQTQIYITPTTRELTQGLRTQNVNFTLPYANAQPSNDRDEEDSDKMSEDSEMEEDDMKKPSNPPKPNSTPNSPSLLLISGSDTISFFNFLTDAKSLLVSNTGSFAGVPPTILSPVAFHGAALKSLQVVERNVVMDKMTLHYIELKGPILPHMLHMLTSLLNKTVKSYKVRLKTVESTVPLNVYANMNQIQGRVKPSAFDLQNLSDCGLNKRILEVFCLSDNCNTIKEMLEGKRGMYRWQ